MAACPTCGREEGCTCVEHGSLLDFLDTFRSAAPSNAAPAGESAGPAVAPEPPMAAPSDEPTKPQPEWAAPAPTVPAWTPPAHEAPPAFGSVPPHQPPNYPPPPGPDPYGAGSYGAPSGPGPGLLSGWRSWGMIVLASVAALMVTASAAVFVLDGHSASAQTKVAGALSRSFGQRTADINFTMTGTFSGQSVSASGNGSVDFVDHSLDLHMTLAPMNMQIEVLFLGSTIYESIPGISTIEPGKTWVSIDLGSVVPKGGTAGSTFNSNPTESLEFLAEKGAQVTELGPSMVNGAPTQGYAISYPASVWKSVLAGPKVPADFRNAMAGVTMTSDVYITSADQLARAVVDISTSTGYSVDETLDFSNYGVATALAPPDSAQVVPFQQFIGDAQANSQAES